MIRPCANRLPEPDAGERLPVAVEPVPVLGRRARSRRRVVGDQLGEPDVDGDRRREDDDERHQQLARARPGAGRPSSRSAAEVRQAPLGRLPDLELRRVRFHQLRRETTTEL